MLYCLNYYLFMVYCLIILTIHRLATILTTSKNSLHSIIDLLTTSKNSLIQLLTYLQLVKNSLIQLLTYLQLVKTTSKNSEDKYASFDNSQAYVRKARNYLSKKLFIYAILLKLFKQEIIYAIL